MAEVSLHGSMGEFIAENTMMIKNMGMENLVGQMVEDTQVNGQMGNSMEKASI